MASFGKIFTKELNPRTTAILAVAKANGINLDVEEVDTTKPTKDFLKYNKLAKVPTFVGNDGYVLTECMAIAIYITSQNEKTTLLGKTKQDYASILKWMSFFNTEVLPKLGAWYRPLLGWDSYNKKGVEDAQKGAEKAISIVEEHLLHNTYLVGERVTLADLFAASIISRGFQFFFDKAWRSKNPNVSRWYETVYNQPIYINVAKSFELLDTPKLTNTPPKKDEKPKAAKAPKAEKAEPKPAPAAEEEAPKPPKHPLASLPPSEFALDEWKRYYSNHDEAESMKYFWENVPFKDYSLWRCKYRYNDELTLTFMSNNLIGGFNTRLEGSRKYLFGCASVYGENNDSVIEGAFVIRGDKYEPVFDVAPDYESYEFTKLDPTNEEDKAFVESMWKWDKPITHEGKEYKHADGKVFK
ncbi:Uu.00g086860.m01.CDS01 [Anthostomella pinea]|uniref:Uu.00g086860.m01.CDS01 n=1 Tax=Anthostomella pinea TaxID=933095 RepID=A0AAI8YJX6_9PEZI|nr:Uu.00g086860.m01.CDS01 [Anthostomella pinea]